MGHVFGGKARLDGVENTGYRVVRFSALEQGWESAVGFFVDMSVDLHRAFPH